MANIDDVRAGIAKAVDKAEQSLGALQEAQSCIEEAQSMLQQVTEGSSQGDVEQANAQFADAVSRIAEVQQAVNAAMQSSEDVANRL